MKGKTRKEKLLKVSEAIATIIESTYTRVAPPMKGDFPCNQNHDTNIAYAIANDFAAFLPDYYQEETLIRIMLLDIEFVQKLFNYFATGIRERIEVKIYNAGEKIPFEMYSKLRYISDSIRDILRINKWRRGELADGENPVFPYCCKKHGRLSDPQIFDSCDSKGSLGKNVKILFDRTISSFFEE